MSAKVMIHVDLAKLLFDVLKPSRVRAWTAVVLRPKCACLRKSTNPKVRMYIKSEREIHILIMQRGYDRQVEIRSAHELDWVLPIVREYIPKHARLLL